ncbi:hypothetical protein BT96DRAFT_1007329 [Gymnopus androsaceus JB14]|uniref:Uncharacterized protein n=1 Tax=Gymnopus androsaceus JB14 TaxID=1447944 RepID=A0A6A4GHX8_9AGAR|nr:hypothetical protein BT96DRAFT_1007329 [Gymnopus androsaceus JB14]
MLSLTDLLNPAPGCPSLPPASLSQDLAFKTETDVTVTQQCTVSQLYTYRRGSLVEYPETSPHGVIGHLFEMDAASWFNPAQAFAYSQGRPEGFSTILKNGNSRQGCKICPYGRPDFAHAHHCSATHEDLQKQKTFALWTASKTLGCTSSPFEPTLITDEELAIRIAEESLNTEIRRGHVAKATCDGRLLLEYTNQGTGRAYVRCKHYNRVLS